jgi:hypothetical protein
MVSTSVTSTLLPSLIKQNAQTDPYGVWAQVPAGTVYADGFRDITNLQLHNAINYTASLIKQNMGESKTFETLAFMGASDPRYSIIVVAGIKTGYKVALPRCGLTPQANTNEGFSAISKEQRGGASFYVGPAAVHETCDDGAAIALHSRDCEEQEATDDDFAFIATATRSRRRERVPL